MTLLKRIERATDFGTIHSRTNFLSFSLKILLYMIPAALLGHFVDVTLQKSKKHRWFGHGQLIYLLVQTLLNLFILYGIIHGFPTFSSEFQKTVSGGHFMILYFGTQTHYLRSLTNALNVFVYHI
jgi:hypothetical protein